MEVIQEVEMSSEGFSEEGASGRRGHVSNGFRPASLQVLDHVKINMEAETPRSTVKEVLKISSRSNLSFSKHELRKAEELMTQAFSEFYQKLKLLKSFSFLNQLAFSKIMKKYDKQSEITSPDPPVLEPEWCTVHSFCKTLTASDTSTHSCVNADAKSADTILSSYSLEGTLLAGWCDNDAEAGCFFLTL